MTNPDLFQNLAPKVQKTEGETGYTARDIEVLEGLEPVRLRPGMYIGGTDSQAFHHLAAEILDNAMDEAVAGHATRIDIQLMEDGCLKVQDNGRGIPIDPHPKFPDKSALEVIMTTLHSGGKFNGSSYATAGGLHGVGLSVVNALSDRMTIEVVRAQNRARQTFSRGQPTGPLEILGRAVNRRGTTVVFHPDPDIFGSDLCFKPALIFQMARSKAYLYRGVEVRWSCAESLIKAVTSNAQSIPTHAVLHFPGGLADYMEASLGMEGRVVDSLFSGLVPFQDQDGLDQGEKVEWAVGWHATEDGVTQSYCNTIPTPDGGTHEAGLRSAITRGLKAYGERTNTRKATQIQAEDVVSGCHIMISIFIPDPQFVGQTKTKLATPRAQRLVDLALRDHFDHWLNGHPDMAMALLTHIIDRAEERQRRRQERDVSRKSATKRLRLPGKLADCSNMSAAGTELFLVEGDSAGGSAKQARNRITQAILPLRGKVLNVASATEDKIRANQEVQDILQVLGCGTGSNYTEADLRYDRIIIMTDADVDGAHIASLLITFFYQKMPKLIENGHLYMAQPPLYRLSGASTVAYAQDDTHKDVLMESTFKGKKVEISRFKGLGEMPPSQLKETTMAPGKRTLLQVCIPKDAQAHTAEVVTHLMGKKPEHRLAFIQANAQMAHDLDI